MKRTKKHRAFRSTAPPSKGAVLDAFTERDLETWDTRSIEQQNHHDRVYYDLERQRVARYDDLTAALRAVSGIDVSVDRWMRVTDWRFRLPVRYSGDLSVTPDLRP